MEADDGPQGSTAILQSPYFKAGEYCFEMYYYMYGEDVGGKISCLTSNTSQVDMFIKLKKILMLTFIHFNTFL